MTPAVIAVCIAAPLVLLWLYLVLPSPRPRDMSPFCISPIAHRGIHDSDGTAENSLTAFALAMDRGYPIELDVRLSRDGEVYVIHDEYLKRLCGTDGSLSKLTANEVAQLRLTEGGEHIPTLRETLKFVDSRVPLLIELKGESLSKIAEKTCGVLKDYNGVYAIQSFNPCLLRNYRRSDPAAPVGILSQSHREGTLGERVLSRLLGLLVFNFMFRPDFISYKHTDKLPLSARLAKRMGTSLLCWTVNEGSDLEKARTLFDGFICENIDRLNYNNT